MVEELFLQKNETNFNNLDEALELGKYLNIFGPREGTDVVVEHLIAKAKASQIEVYHIPIPDGGVKDLTEMMEIISKNSCLSADTNPNLPPMTNLSRKLQALSTEKEYLFIVNSIDNLPPNTGFNENFFLGIRALANAKENGKTKNVTFALVGELHPNELLPLDKTGQFNKGENFLVRIK